MVNSFSQLIHRLVTGKNTGAMCGATPRAGASLRFLLVECVVRRKLQAFFRKKIKKIPAGACTFFNF